MSENQFENLRKILLEPEKEHIVELERQLDRLRRQLNNKKILIETLRPVISDSISQKIHESKEEMAETLAPVIGSAIKHQIKNAKDEVVDALYPVIGQTIRKSVAEAMKNLAHSVNRKLDQTFSLRLWSKRIKARISGVSPDEAVLSEVLPFRIHEIFLIHKENGILLAHVSESGAEATADDELVSGMLTAIRDFSQTAFDSEEKRDLSEIQYEDLDIKLEIGRYAYLAFVTSGVEPGDFDDNVRNLAQELRKKYAPVLRNFEGDTESLSPVKKILRHFLLEYTPPADGSATSENETEKASHGLLYLLLFLLLAAVVYLGAFYIPRKIQEKKLTTQIARLWQSHPVLAESGVQYRVKGEKVYLAGTVNSLATRKKVDSLLSAEPGVKEIINQVRLKSLGITPGELLIKLQKSLAGSLSTRLDKIRFIVNDDQLLLEGTAANLPEKLLLGKEVAKLSGFRLIVNNLEVQNKNAGKGAKFKDQVEEICLHFRQGSSKIIRSEYAVLDQLVTLLKQHPFERLNIFGHCDPLGKESLNMSLSKKRAETVKKFLVDRGISSFQIFTFAKGASEPVTSVKNEKKWYLNRRANFELILKK